MRTLRERLSTPGRKVLDIEGAPSFIHNFDFADEDGDLQVSWTDEDGQIFEEEFPLDEESPECGVCLLTTIE
jgi:hypothetical protein